MYLDLQNYHPEESRVPRAISVREGVLLSLVAHLVALLTWVLMPHSAAPMVPLTPVDPVQYVQLMSPRPTPKNLTRERPPDPKNDAPLVRGTSPEKIVAPEDQPKPADPSAADPAPAQPPAAPPPLVASADPARAAPSSEAHDGAALRNSLSNLQKFLHAESYDNPQGGQSQQLGDIQFDDKGVDFGPWLARFKAQIERNWRPPEALTKGHVQFQFDVLRNGTIIDIRMILPSGVQSYDVSAMSALKLSNPTMRLPDEYPDDKILFTVTFHYNENIREP